MSPRGPETETAARLLALLVVATAAKINDQAEPGASAKDPGPDLAQAQELL